MGKRGPRHPRPPVRLGRNPAKLCPKCGKVKLLDEFYFTRGVRKRRQAYCKVCKTEIARTFRKEHTTRIKHKDFSNKLSWQYGITEEQYNAMFEQQKGCCAICGKHQSQQNIRLCIDHDHKTGRIRGLLCQKCNIGLGWLEKLRDFLPVVWSYLGEVES